MREGGEREGGEKKRRIYSFHLLMGDGIRHWHKHLKNIFFFSEKVGRLEFFRFQFLKDLSKKVLEQETVEIGRGMKKGLKEEGMAAKLYPPSTTTTTATKPFPFFPGSPFPLLGTNPSSSFPFLPTAPPPFFPFLIPNSIE